MIVIYDAIGGGGIAQGLKLSIKILSFFWYATLQARSKKTKWVMVFNEVLIKILKK